MFQTEIKRSGYTSTVSQKGVCLSRFWVYSNRSCVRAMTDSTYHFFFFLKLLHTQLNHLQFQWPLNKPFTILTVLTWQFPLASTGGLQVLYPSQYSITITPLFIWHLIQMPWSIVSSSFPFIRHYTVNFWSNIHFFVFHDAPTMSQMLWEVHNNI